MKSSSKGFFLDSLAADFHRDTGNITALYRGYGCRARSQDRSHCACRKKNHLMHCFVEAAVTIARRTSIYAHIWMAENSRMPETAHCVDELVVIITNKIETSGKQSLQRVFDLLGASGQAYRVACHTETMEHRL